MDTLLRGCLKSQKMFEKSGQNPQFEGYEYHFLPLRPEYCPMEYTRTVDANQIFNGQTA
jgi:hypothetical protein